MRAIVDAGQRLVGEQPAQRVGAQPAGGGQLGHAEAGRPDRSPRWAARRRRRSTTASARTSPTDVGLEHGDAQAWRSHLATERRPGSHSDGASMPAADQRDRAALLGQLGGRFDAGQPGADHGDGRIGVQIVEGVAQPLRACSNSAIGIGEFGRTGHGRRRRLRCCRPRR